MSNEKQLRGISQEMQSKAESIVKMGHEENKSMDEICVDLFEAGVTFSAIERVYKHFSLALGYIVDPAEVKKNLAEEIGHFDVRKLTTWELVDKYVNTLAEKVNGASAKSASWAVRNAAKAVDYKLPKRPAGAASAGIPRIRRVIIDQFSGDKIPTKEELVSALYPNVIKKRENAEKRVDELYDMLVAVKKKMGTDKYLDFKNSQETEQKEAA